MQFYGSIELLSLTSPQMSQAITIDVVGDKIITVTHVDSFVTLEITPGALSLKTAGSALSNQNFPLTIQSENHKGKLEIRDGAGRLVYSWRSLDQFLANTRHGSNSKLSSSAFRVLESKMLISSTRCSNCRSHWRAAIKHHRYSIKRIFCTSDDQADRCIE